MSNINYVSKLFVNITLRDVRKIMNIETKVNNFSLLRYYIVLISTFRIDKSETSGKIGYMPQSYLRDISGLSIPTMNKYNDILEENKLIFIEKSSDHEEYYDGNGNHRLVKFRNVYARYEDRHLASSYTDTHSTITYDSKIDIKTNESRKYVQMYNSMLKGKKYDIGTVSQIYKAMKDWNSAKKQKYEEQIQEGYSPKEPKYKDLSIFDEYELN